MKRRATKKRVQKEENNLTARIQQAISETNEDAMRIVKFASSLGTDLTYLLSERLRLKPSWSLKNRWLDGIEWDSLMAVSSNEIRGRGKIWWGNVNDLAGEQTSEPFEADMRVENRKHPRLSYSLKFTINGSRFEFNVNIRRSLCDPSATPSQTVTTSRGECHVRSRP